MMFISEDTIHRNALKSAVYELLAWLAFEIGFDARSNELTARLIYYCLRAKPQEREKRVAHGENKPKN